MNTKFRLVQGWIGEVHTVDSAVQTAGALTSTYSKQHHKGAQSDVDARHGLGTALSGSRSPLNCGDSVSNDIFTTR